MSIAKIKPKFILSIKKVKKAILSHRFYIFISANIFWQNLIS